jgi:uncharacterized protein HemX
MKFRILIPILVAVCVLAFVGFSYGQARKRVVRREADTTEDSGGAEHRPNGIASSATLERRVQELENQVQSLAQELQALKKELKPLANQPGRPRLLKALPAEDL